MSERVRPDQIPNDQETFATLYKERRERMFSTISGIVRDRTRAEDLTAAAFQTAWEKRSQFRGDSSLATWLHAIGVNAARRSWREERPAEHSSLEMETVSGHEADRLADRLEEDHRRALLGEALLRIPAKCRRVLIDHYLTGRSVREIAQREQIPEGTVTSRLFTARQLLRQAWPDAADRNMKEDKVRHITEEALNRLAEELRAGRSEGLRNYLAAMGRFHRYSWNNALLIQAQRPAATRVAGYHTWRDFGRSVRKGEKGIMIYAPVVLKARDAEKTPERIEAKPSPERTAPALRFRTAYVFDVEQTEGKPLPAFAQTTGDPKAYTDKLKALIAREGIAIEYDQSIKPALGLSYGGRIRVLPDLSPAEEFSVLTHEFAHEILHHKTGVDRAPQVVRETQAEAVAFAVSRGIGLENHRAASDYIALYNGNEKTLADSLAVVHDTAAHILRDLLPQEREQDERTHPRERSHIRQPIQTGRAGPTLEQRDPVESTTWDR